MPQTIEPTIHESLNCRLTIRSSGPLRIGTWRKGNLLSSEGYFRNSNRGSKSNQCRGLWSSLAKLSASLRPHTQPPLIGGALMPLICFILISTSFLQRLAARSSSVIRPNYSSERNAAA
jgi:hypothetical protein